MKSVECVAFSSDSRLLCSGSWDKSAVLWNTEVISRRVVNHLVCPCHNSTFRFGSRIIIAGFNLSFEWLASHSCWSLRLIDSQQIACITTRHVKRGQGQNLEVEAEAKFKEAEQNNALIEYLTLVIL